MGDAGRKANEEESFNTIICGSERRGATERLQLIPDAPMGTAACTEYSTE